MSTSIIVDKIHNASGSKYSSIQPSRSGAIPLRPNYKVASTGAAEDDWGGAPPIVESSITKVQSAYKPTKVDISSIKSSSTKVEPVQGTYQPTGKVDIAAIRAAGKKDRFADDRPTPLQSSYKPIGKVDIAAIRAQANAKSEGESAPVVVTPVVPSRSSTDDSSERTLNVKDRLKTWGSNAEPEEAEVGSESVHSRINSYSTTSGRLTELPKHKVSNTVGSRFSGVSGGATRGTAPTLPKTSSLFAGESKAAAGFKNFGAQNGRTPAQLWAEKHARNQPTASVASEPVREAPVVHKPEPAQEPEQEQEYEKPDMSALRSQFSRATVEEETPAVPLRAEPPIQQTRFSDITSRFAQGNTPTPAAAPAPVAEYEPEPIQEEVPAPPVNFSSRPPIVGETIAIPTPVARHTEPEPEPEPVHQESAAAAATGTIAIAAYDYDKDEENEISLKEGELVTDIEFVDTDWWSGKNSRGEAGLFPSSYVEVQQEVSGADPVHELAHEEHAHEEPAHEEPAHEEPSPSSGFSARAEYDYEATEDGELSFPEGAVITEIDFVDEAWWSGVYGGVRALFPANYVTLQE